MGYANGAKVVDGGAFVETREARGASGGDTPSSAMLSDRMKFDIGGRKLREMIEHAARANLARAVTVSFDGPNRAGKNTQIAGTREWMTTQYRDIDTFVFKDSLFGDPDAVARWRDFRRRYGKGGNPIEATDLASRVRRTALDTPQVQAALANPKGLFLYQRSFIDTAVYRLIDSLNPENRSGRTATTFLEAMFEIMAGSYFIPDFTIMLDIDRATMLARMGNGGGLDNPGELPSETYIHAYQFLASNTYRSKNRKRAIQIIPNRVAIDGTESVDMVTEKVKAYVRRALIKKGLISET